MPPFNTEMANGFDSIFSDKKKNFQLTERNFIKFGIR